MTYVYQHTQELQAYKNGSEIYLESSKSDQISDVIDDDDDKKKWNNIMFLTRFCRIRSLSLRMFLAETLGTFLKLVIGLGAVAQNTFNSGPNIVPVNIAFGLAVTISVIVTGKVSGAHLNPAVSLCVLITGRMSSKRFFIYVLGQFIGSFLAAVFVYFTYIENFLSYKGGFDSFDLPKIFATYPSENVSNLASFFDQVSSTALLIIFIMAISDEKNENIPHAVKAILVGMLVTAIGLSYALNCGYALNPARDLAPRLFTLIVWGGKTFSSNNYFFWIPVVAPMFGSLVGTLIYTLTIGNHW